MLRCSLPGACWLRLAAAATLCVALAGAIGACGDAAPAPAQRPQRPAAAAQPAEPVVAEPAADQRKTERFAGVVFVHGLPKGVAPLSPLQAVRRRHLLVDSGGGDPTSSFKLVDDRGQVTKSWSVEELGEDWHQVEEHDANEAIVELHTVTDAGRTVDKRRGDGRRLDPNCARYRRDLNGAGQVVAERCLGDDDEPRESSEGIQELRYEVNASGYVTSVKALDAYERPHALAKGREGRGPLRDIFLRRFERNAGGQAVEETTFDRDGEPVEDLDGIFRRARSFDDAGRITHLVRYGRDGKRTGGRSGVAEERKIFVDGRLKEQGFLSAQGAPVRLPEGCTRILYETDSNGRITRETYADTEGNPVLHDDLGAATLAHSYDERGRRTQTDYLDNEGRPTHAKGRGYGGLRWTFDEAGRVIETARVTATGTPADVKQAGWAVHRVTHDATGRLASEQYEDGTHGLVAGPEGWARRLVTHQPATDGSMAVDTITETFDAAGQPTRTAGTTYAKMIERVSDKERLLSRAWFDAKGAPAVATEGRVHQIKQTWTPAGRLASVSYFGVDGNPVLSAVTGAHQTRYTYQAQGGEVKQEHLGVDNQPITGSEGWATRERLIDDMGRLVELRDADSKEHAVGRAGDSVAREYRFYGVGETLRQQTFMAESGETMHVLPGGYARVVFDHDDQMRVTSTGYYDAAERAVIRDDLAYSSETRRYGDNGLLAEIRYHDNTEAPLYVPGLGYSGVRFEYDDTHRLVRKTLLGPEWSATLTPLGYSETMMEYVGDSWTLRSLSYTDPKGRPTFTREGFAAVRMDFDSRGRKVRELHTDTLGNSVTDTGGASERVWRYAGEHLVGFRTIGSTGEPTAAFEGTAGYDLVLDGYGRTLKRTSVDPNELPTYAAETGCATVSYTLNAHGEPTRTECRDAKGQLIKGNGGWAAREQTFNHLGQVVTVALEDETGALTLGDEGWAKEVRFFDERGHVRAKAWIGADELPATLSAGYSGIKFTRDTYGRVLREEYLDDAGNPTANAEGYAGKSTTWDTHGRVIEEAIIDVTGRPSDRAGHSITRTTWSTTGRMRERRYLDAAGKATTGPEGWAILRPEYDARGHVTRNTYFLSEGQPGHASEAWSVEQFIIDRFGRVREVTYADHNGRQVNRRVGKQAFAIEKREFDRYGNRADQSFFDAEGRPTEGPEGVHRMRWSWNEQGQLVAQARYQTATRPAAGGWARQSYLYDLFGRLSTIGYQDTMGRPSSVWNGVATVRFAYNDLGRLDVMTYHDNAELPMNAKVCYPGKYCGGAPIAEARYVYAPGGDRPVAMDLFDRAGKSIKTLDCAKGECF